MGRVHKKKLAQYKDSEGADDEQSVASKDESGRGDEDKDEDKSAANNSDADTEDLTAGDSKKNSKGDDSEHEDDSDADGGDSEVEEKSTKNGKRATKRKSGPKRAQKNDSEAEDDDADANENGDALEENGGTPAKRGKKTAGGKKKLSPAKGGRKSKTVKNDAENDEDEEDNNVDVNEEEYEVKEVVGHKVEKGVTFYLIRWKGYTKDDDTWESEETLSCQDLIDKYNKKNNTTKNSKTTPGKKSTENNEKHKGRPAKNAGKPAKKEEDPDKEWEVEKIIDYAEEKEGRVFRIRWKGYGPKGDTWEPEKNLSCGDLIEKFMKKMNDQKDLSFKELRETPKKTKRLVNETTPRSDPSARKSKRSAE